MKKVDVKIGEQFSDDYDLKESLENGRSVDDFLCLALWHKKILLKIEMICKMLVGDDDDVMHGDDVGPEASTADIEWTVINPQSPLSSLYLHYQMFKGAKRRLSTSDNLRI